MSTSSRRSPGPAKPKASKRSKSKADDMDEDDDALIQTMMASTKGKGSAKAAAAPASDSESDEPSDDSDYMQIEQNLEHQEEDSASEEESMPSAAASAHSGQTFADEVEAEFDGSESGDNDEEDGNILLDETKQEDDDGEDEESESEGEYHPGQAKLDNLRRLLQASSLIPDSEEEVQEGFDTHAQPADLIDPDLRSLWRQRKERTNNILRSAVQTGFTSSHLLLNLSKWFPNTSNVLVSSVAEDKNALKETTAAKAGGVSLNGVEKERMEKLLKFDQLVGLEAKADSAPPISKTLRQKLGRLTRLKTLGKGWFDLPRQETSKEDRQELLALRMRSFTDPSRFYKKTHKDPLPKHYEFGRVEHSPLDKSQNPTRKQSRMGFVDELLTDLEYRKFAKRKYREIQDKKSKGSKAKRQKTKR